MKSSVYPQNNSAKAGGKYNFTGNFTDTLVGKSAFEKIVDPNSGDIIILQGDDITIEVAEKLSNARFETIKIARERCFHETPELVEIKKEHFTACHFIKEINDLK